MKTRIAAVAALSLAFPAFAADYLGAAGALKRFAAETVQQKDPETKKTPLEAWREKVKAFARTAAPLEPKEAAARWLALFDEWRGMPLAQAEEINFGYSSPLSSIMELFAALPEPPAWEALAAAIAARPVEGDGAALQHSLQMLGQMLSGDYTQLSPTLKEMRKAMAKNREGSSHLSVKELSAWVSSLNDDKKEALQMMEENIAEFEKGEMSGTLAVPDLVTLIGPEKSEALLRRLLKTPGMDIRVEVGDATRSLAVKLAVELAAELKKPQWELITGISPAEVTLYEALNKRFPRKNDDEDQDHRPPPEADRKYLFGLIAAHRSEEAAKFAAALAERQDGETSLTSYNGTDFLVRAGLVQQVQSFFREVLAKNPALPFWQELIDVSAQSGKAQETVAFMREIAAWPDLAPAARETLESHLWAALLAADDVDGGVKLLRAVLAAKLAKLEKQPAVSARLRSSFTNRSDPEEAGELAQKLSEIGRLLQRPELIEEGLKGVKLAIAAAARSSSSDITGLVHQTAGFLLSMNRGPEAEEFVLSHAIAMKKMAKESGQFLNDDQHLADLAAIYHRAGRHEDVMKLLTDAPGWRAGDLANLMTDQAIDRLPLGYMAASAMAATGRKDEARKVLVHLLEADGGFDPAYELLIQLDGADAMKELVRLAARDRFEERPLIWQAKLQLDAGQLAEAEKTIRAAIAIDPSDGEQGKGTRMRAYAVLADILDKKGDPAQAKLMRGAVEAIRLSENADDWWQAGLLSRSVKMYEEALGHFADAYCIQSRLALRYSELGNQAKAEEHYRRAYELMPESFGRVESHCFGCESAFSGERAQSIADKVFTGLAQTMPGKPQVFYLLGYLREAQENYQEAAKNYHHAVELDPDYLNAWLKQLEISQHIALPRADREAAALAALRLDPLGRHKGHSSYSAGFNNEQYSEIADLRTLWKELAQSVNLRGTGYVNIFPLTASKAELERKAKAEEETGRSRFNRIRDLNSDQLPLTPGILLAKHKFLLLLSQIMQIQLQFQM